MQWAYLESRQPLPVHSNPAISLPRRDYNGWRSQLLWVNTTHAHAHTYTHTHTHTHTQFSCLADSVQNSPRSITVVFISCRSRSRWRRSARMTTFNLICTQTPVYSVNHCCQSDPLTCRSAPSHVEEKKQLFKQNSHMKWEHLSASSWIWFVFLGFWQVILICLSISVSHSLLFYSFGVILDNKVCIKADILIFRFSNFLILVSASSPPKNECLLSLIWLLTLSRFGWDMSYLLCTWWISSSVT